MMSTNGPDIGAAPCSRCGYDLRGSLARGRCPECGWQFPPDALFISVYQPGEGPSIVQSLTAIVVFTCALVAIIRQSNIMRAETIIILGFLLFSIIVGGYEIRRWRRSINRIAKSGPQEILMLTDEELILWRGGQAAERIRGSWIDTLRVKRFWRHAYLTLRTTAGRKVAVQFPARKETITALKRRLKTLLSD